MGRKIITLSVCFLIFVAGIIFAQDENRNKYIEKKWGIGEDEDWRIKKPDPLLNVTPSTNNVFPIFLEPFRAEVQVFQINPGMENKITGKFGTEITIPGNSISLPASFRRGDVITFELIEILNDLDFVTTGLDMLYYDSKSKPNILESAGMFKIRGVYYNRDLNLKRGARINVSIPRIPSDRKMRIYKYDENKSGWLDQGAEEVVTIPESAGRDVERPSTPPTRFSSLISQFGYWNFDYPNPDITCIEGKIKTFEPNPPYTITIIGQDYAGAYSKHINESNFKINAPKNKEIKILVSDSKGNLGYLDIKSPNKDGFVTFGTKDAVCSDIGSPEIKKTGPEVRNNRDKLLQYLGMSDRFK